MVLNHWSYLRVFYLLAPWENDFCFASEPVLLLPWGSYRLNHSLPEHHQSSSWHFPFLSPSFPDLSPTYHQTLLNSLSTIFNLFTYSQLSAVSPCSLPLWKRLSPRPLTSLPSGSNLISCYPSACLAHPSCLEEPHASRTPFYRTRFCHRPLLLSLPFLSKCSTCRRLENSGSPVAPPSPSAPVFSQFKCLSSGSP